MTLEDLPLYARGMWKKFGGILPPLIGEHCIREVSESILGCFLLLDRAIYILTVLQRAEEVGVVADLHWEVHLDIVQGNEAFFGNALCFETQNYLLSDVSSDVLR